MDLEALAQQLIRALRGRRSQVAFSRRLGFKTNVAYAWESGRRWPTAALTLRAAARSRIDVPAALARFFPSAPAWLRDVDVASRPGVARVLSELRAQVPIVDIARRAGRSRYAVARWLSGAAEPRLPDFLRLIDACSLRLLDFVALFADPTLLPEARDPWKMLQAHRRAAYEMPWIPAVLHALELREYAELPAHVPGWIASRIGIGAAEEAECLEVLEQSGQIRRRGKRLVSGTAIAVDTRQDPAAERRLKSWWAKVGMDRLAAGSPGQFSFNVFTVSEEDLERLRELHRSYFRTMRSIIASSTPSERIVVANIQLFPLDSESGS